MQVLDSKLTSKVCDHDKPQLNFPFKVKSLCKHNQIMLSFRRYGNLGVKSISYDPNKLTLTDPKDCVFEVFLNLNLDTTPFRYYHVVKSYKYLNCSINRLESFKPVPCLSGSKHYVYVVESSLHVPSSCEVVKTVLIPFSYSSYVSDASFGLDLTWDSAGFEDIGVRSIGSGLSVIFLVFVVVGLGCVKVYYLKKSPSNEHELEMLLGKQQIL
ncbi:putative RING-H2 finger protein ATL21A [Bidens hawaiensis]|uniref:putative RING-H2 finger protein ATL21A n=1 Tax=Bidens hawaiensis TaxID=980011 RepID=UPI004049EF93